jgi:hypothetical protein
MHPIAMIQATEMTRRAVRGSGPSDARSDRAPRRARPVRRANLTRPAAAPSAAGAACGAAPVRTVNVVDA